MENNIKAQSYIINQKNEVMRKMENETRTMKMFCRVCGKVRTFYLYKEWFEAGKIISEYLCNECGVAVRVEC